MRSTSLLLVTALAACASTKGESPAVQEIVESVAAHHPDLVRLTVHAVPQGETECRQIASTMPERRGKKSDAEDREAMRTGKQIVLDEAGAVDVTVPILMKDGYPQAIAGVTLRAGTSRDATVAKARVVADEVAAKIRAAGKPLW